MVLNYAPTHDDNDFRAWPTSRKLWDDELLDGKNTKWRAQGRAFTALGADEQGGWAVYTEAGEGAFEKLCQCPSMLSIGHRRMSDRSIQLELLPAGHEIAIIVDQLSKDDLQELAQAVVGIVVTSARQGNIDLPHLRLFNEWWGSMEETVAAGDCLDEILERRYKDSEFTE